MPSGRRARPAARGHRTSRQGRRPSALFPSRRIRSVESGPSGGLRPGGARVNHGGDSRRPAGGRLSRVVPRRRPVAARDGQRRRERRTARDAGSAHEPDGRGGRRPGESGVGRAHRHVRLRVPLPARRGSVGGRGRLPGRNPKRRDGDGPGERRALRAPGPRIHLRGGRQAGGRVGERRRDPERRAGVQRRPARPAVLHRASEDRDAAASARRRVALRLFGSAGASRRSEVQRADDPGRIALDRRHAGRQSVERRVHAPGIRRDRGRHARHVPDPRGGGERQRAAVLRRPERPRRRVDSGDGRRRVRSAARRRVGERAGRAFHRRDPSGRRDLRCRQRAPDGNSVRCRAGQHVHVARDRRGRRAYGPVVPDYDRGAVDRTGPARVGRDSGRHPGRRPAGAPRPSGPGRRRAAHRVCAPRRGPPRRALAERPDHHRGPEGRGPAHAVHGGHHGQRRGNRRRADVPPCRRRGHRAPRRAGRPHVDRRSEPAGHRPVVESGRAGADARRVPASGRGRGRFRQPHPRPLPPEPHAGHHRARRRGRVRGAHRVRQRRGNRRSGRRSQRRHAGPADGDHERPPDRRPQIHAHVRHHRRLGARRHEIDHGVSVPLPPVGRRGLWRLERRHRGRHGEIRDARRSAVRVRLRRATAGRQRRGSDSVRANPGVHASNQEPERTSGPPIAERPERLGRVVGHADAAGGHGEHVHHGVSCDLSLRSNRGGSGWLLQQSGDHRAFLAPPLPGDRPKRDDSSPAGRRAVLSRVGQRRRPWRLAQRRMGKLRGADSLAVATRGGAGSTPAADRGAPARERPPEAGPAVRRVARPGLDRRRRQHAERHRRSVGGGCGSDRL